MDAAGFETAHLVGNSLGGWIVLELAARGRARSVSALAPAGGWDPGNRWAAGQLLAARRPAAAPLADEAAGPRPRRPAARPLARPRRRSSPTRPRSPPGWRRADPRRRRLPGGDAAAARVEGERLPGPRPRSTAPCGSPGGRRTTCCPYKHVSARFRSQLPQASGWTSPARGTCPQIDHPEATAELILAVSDRG